MAAPQPSTADQLTQRLVDNPVPELDCFDTTIVRLAAVQAGESVLFITCRQGSLIVEVLRSVGKDHGLFVCLDAHHLPRQQTALAVEASGLEENVSILECPQYGRSGITTSLSSAGRPSQFDAIIAFRALPSDRSQHQAILHDWAAFLTPETGRMIVSAPACGEGYLPLYSAIQVISSRTREIILHANALSNDERRLLMEEFQDTLKAAGLSVSITQPLTRVDEARSTVDLAPALERSFREEWVPQQGGDASVASKADFLAQVTDDMTEAILAEAAKTLDVGSVGRLEEEMEGMSIYPEILLTVGVGRVVAE